jgi:hypothetical protein
MRAGPAYSGRLRRGFPERRAGPPQASLSPARIVPSGALSRLRPSTCAARRQGWPVSRCTYAVGKSPQPQFGRGASAQQREGFLDQVLLNVGARFEGRSRLVDSPSSLAWLQRQKARGISRSSEIRRGSGPLLSPMRPEATERTMSVHASSTPTSVRPEPILLQ